MYVLRSRLEQILLYCTLILKTRFCFQDYFFSFRSEVKMGGYKLDRILMMTKGVQTALLYVCPDWQAPRETQPVGPSFLGYVVSDPRR